MQSNKTINQENMFLALRLNKAKSVVKKQRKDSKDNKSIKPEELQRLLESNNPKVKCLNVVSSDNIAFMMKFPYQPKVTNVFKRLSDRSSSKDYDSSHRSSIYTERVAPHMAPDSKISQLIRKHGKQPIKSMKRPMTRSGSIKCQMDQVFIPSLSTAQTVDRQKTKNKSVDLSNEANADGLQLSSCKRPVTSYNYTVDRRNEFASNPLAQRYKNAKAVKRLFSSTEAHSRPKTTAHTMRSDSKDYKEIYENNPGIFCKTHRLKIKTQSNNEFCNSERQKLWAKLNLF